VVRRHNQSPASLLKLPHAPDQCGHVLVFVAAGYHGRDRFGQDDIGPEVLYRCNSVRGATEFQILTGFDWRPIVTPPISNKRLL
jgi:hypothetical protein